MNDTTESHFIKLEGKTFTCACGCNMFHYWPHPPAGKIWDVCNVCDTTYESDVKNDWNT